VLLGGVEWFEKLRNHLNVIFTEEDFRIYSEMVEQVLPIYRKHLKDGARILDVGCGLGCSSIPLSTRGYEVVGIDNDPRVIRAARQNGKKFGGRIQFKLMDAFDIDERFDQDSFDACMHGGLLEHFPEDQIRVLIDKQLRIAPLIFCSVPVRTERTMRHYGIREVDGRQVCVDGIQRNLWTADEWMKDILMGYRIIHHEMSSAIPQIGDFDELGFIIGRSRSEL